MRRRKISVAAAWTMLLSCVGPAAAAICHLGVDAPVTLGGADYLPGDIVRADGGGVYSLELSLGLDGSFAALGRLPDGVWLLVPAKPIFLPSGPADSRDVLLFDGAAVTKLFDGGASGVAAGSGIDAALLDPEGDLVLSFDVPVDLDGVEYGPSDLVMWRAGGFVLYWDAAAAGVPEGSNVSGAALDNDGSLRVTFDAPTTLDGTEYMPGTLVAFDQGTTFHPFIVDALWPETVHVTGFTIAPTGAGAVPDGGGLPGPPLTVTPAAGGDITLTWGASCGSADFDYEVYEGTLGDYYSHEARFCSTGGMTAITFTPDGAGSYYLVVPRNLQREGSYGTDSAGVERPASASACLIRQTAVCQ